MRGLSLWMVIVAVGGLVLLPASGVFGESAITKGPTPGGLYIVGPGHGTNYPVLYYSSDYGKTLTPMDSTSDMCRITADASEGGVYYRSGGGGLYYSQDYGDSFVYQSGIGSIGGEISSGNTPGEIYVNGVWYSSDYGKTFIKKLGQGLEGAGATEDISVGCEEGEIYFLGKDLSSKVRLYFSSNYGDSFTFKHEFIPTTAWFWSLRRGAVAGEVYLLCRTTGQLYYSSDYGETFKEKKKFPGEDFHWSMDMVGGVNPGDVFVERDRIYWEGGGEIHIYYSADYGSTFVEYKHVFDAVEEEPWGQMLPREVSLGQNFPNPFNSATSLNYTLPQVIGERFKVKGGPNTSHLIPVTLKIYNILGEEVRTLVDSKKTPGEYQVVWDGKDRQGKEVSSGIYFCRLKVLGDRCKVVKTRKMVLLR